MNHADFDKLVERELQRMKDVMCSKSEDYAADDDKLFNFKLSAELDGISSIEALRGMWLKHRTSIRQGLDELMTGKCRPKEWWIEKLTDDRNYSILLQALLEEKYFNEQPKEVGEFTIQKAQDSCKGWYIILTRANGNCYSGVKFLHKDLQLRNTTGWDPSYKYAEAPGYYESIDAAMVFIVFYHKAKREKLVVPSPWLIAFHEDYYVGSDCGWFVINRHTRQHLHKDLRLHDCGTGCYSIHYGYDNSPGYWPTKEAAEDCLRRYLENQS